MSVRSWLRWRRPLIFRDGAGRWSSAYLRWGALGCTLYRNWRAVEGLRRLQVLWQGQLGGWAAWTRGHWWRRELTSLGEVSHYGCRVGPVIVLWWLRPPWKCVEA